MSGCVERYDAARIFENQNEMKEVRDRITLVYAGCIEGQTAAEVYAVPANPSAAVRRCGDLRP